MTTTCSTERKQLGPIVSAVVHRLSAIDQFYDDPITRSSGCADELAPYVITAALREVGKLLHEAGFADFDDFYLSIESATAALWTYNALGGLDQAEVDETMVRACELCEVHDPAAPCAPVHAAIEPEPAPEPEPEVEYACPSCETTDDVEFIGVHHEVVAEFICHACGTQWGEQ